MGHYDPSSAVFVAKTIDGNINTDVISTSFR
jgi:hypothetical protein